MNVSFEAFERYALNAPPSLQLLAERLLSEIASEHGEQNFGGSSHDDFVAYFTQSKNSLQNLDLSDKIYLENLVLWACSLWREADQKAASKQQPFQILPSIKFHTINKELESIELKFQRHHYVIDWYLDHVGMFTNTPLPTGLRAEQWIPYLDFQSLEMIHAASCRDQKHGKPPFKFSNAPDTTGLETGHLIPLLGPYAAHLFCAMGGRIPSTHVTTESGHVISADICATRWDELAISKGKSPRALQELIWVRTNMEESGTFRTLPPASLAAPPFAP